MIKWVRNDEIVISKAEYCCLKATITSLKDEIRHLDKRLIDRKFIHLFIIEDFNAETKYDKYLKTRAGNLKVFKSMTNAVNYINTICKDSKEKALRYSISEVFAKNIK